MSFVKYCEDHVLRHGGRIVRGDIFAHGELNGFVFPARTSKEIFWKETLFSPAGLIAVTGLKTKKTKNA